MNNGCSTHGWSVIASASMDSALAGVLAGFVFTSIVLLLGRRGPKDIQALGLFCTAFIALGLDSHLFGVISGGTPDPFCVRVWSEEMVAAGMLAVGAMAIITGISWLLASHLDSTVESSEASVPSQPHRVINLDRLVQLMAYGVGVTVTLLLAATTYDYLSIAYPTQVPTPLSWTAFAFASTAFVSVVASGIATLRTRYASHKYVARTNLANAGLRVAAYGILGYAVAGPVFVGFISELRPNWWRPPSDLVVGAAITGGLALPALLLIALVVAVPPLAAKGHDGRPDALDVVSRHP